MKYIVRLTAMSILSLSALSCNHNEDRKDVPSDQQEETWQMITLSPRHITGTVRLPGMLAPFEFAQIYPKVNGFVKDIFVDRGSIVKKGQVLLKLEAPEILEAVSTAKLK
jgi:membrane fusion protein, multidrug efflux system